MSAGSSQEDNLFKVFKAGPDHLVLCEWDCCGLEVVFAFLLSFEVLGHGEGVIELLIEGVHDFSDFTGFDNVVWFFHVVEES